jgi:hypothetical protein
MNLEAMMDLEGLITITLVIAAIGTTLTQVFRNADSPYIVTLSGSRLALVMYGVLMTAIAVGLGVAVLFIVSTFAAPMVGLALFFGIEAVALDICFHRTSFVRVAAPAAEHTRVHVTLPF